MIMYCSEQLIFYLPSDGLQENGLLYHDRLEPPLHDWKHDDTIQCS